MYILAIAIMVLAAFYLYVKYQNSVSGGTGRKQDSAHNSGNSSDGVEANLDNILTGFGYRDGEAADGLLDEASAADGNANYEKVSFALKFHELAVLKGHEQWINTIAFSPDGTRIASGSSDNTVRVWDLIEMKELEVFAKHQGKVLSVAFSPDGTLVASGGADEKIILWSLTDGESMRTIDGLQAPVSQVGFSADGFLVGGQSGSAVRVWDVETGDKITTRSRHEFECKSMAFSPGGPYMALGGIDAVVELWDNDQRMEKDSFMAAMRTGSIISLAFTSDGEYLAAGSTNRTVNIWNAYNGRRLYSFRGRGSGEYMVTFMPGDRVLAAWGRSKIVDFWDISSGRDMPNLEAKEWIIAFAFSPDAQYAASAGADKCITIYRVERKQV